MKEMIRSRSSMLLLAIIVLVAVFLLPNSNAFGAAEVMSFKVENRSNDDFSITLSDPATGKVQYSYYVAPKTNKQFSPAKGKYLFSLVACDMTASGTLDLTKTKTMIVPICGATAKHEGKNPHKIDVSSLIRPIRLTVKNRTNDRVTLLLTNTTTRKSFYLELGVGKNTVIFVPKGEYRYDYVACGDSKVGLFFVKVNKPFIMSCK